MTNLGGYIAREQGWPAFETAVEQWFSEFGVNLPDAKDLEDTNGNFKNWKRLRKHAFVSRIFQELRRSIPLGIASSAVKDAYEAGASAHARKSLPALTS